MFIFLTFYLIWIFGKFFEKKLLILLSLEGAMLMVICLIQVLELLNSFSLLMLIILSVFMVLDSVFGVSLLISCSRSSAKIMKILS